MNKVLKKQNFIKNHLHRKQSDNLYEFQTQRIFNYTQNSLEIRQTSQTISFKNNKLLPTKTISSKLISINGKSISNLKQYLDKFALNNISFQYQEENIKLIENKKLINVLIEEAVQNIGDKLQTNLEFFAKVLYDKKTLFQTLKIIEQQYQGIKNQIKQTFENNQVGDFLHILSQNIRYPQPNDLISILYQQIPQIYQYFDTFNINKLSKNDQTQLKLLKYEILPILMNINAQEVKNQQKKKKKKKKNKKINANQQIQSEYLSIQQSEENQKFNKVIKFLEDLQIIQEKRLQCRVTEEWVNKLQKQSYRLKSKLQS